MLVLAARFSLLCKGRNMYRHNPLSRRFFSGMVAALFFTAAPITSAWAGTTVYYLDQSNAPSALPDGTDYLKITITSNVAGTATFDVSPIYNFTQGQNFGLQSFGFNYSGPGSLTSISFSGLASGWGITQGTAQDGFGKYDFVLGTSGSGRLSPLDFTVTGLGGDTTDQTLGYFAKLSTGAGSQGNQYFVAHLSGFTAGSTSSTYFAGTTLAPAPEPATYGMLLGGLALLGFKARRHKKV